MGPETRLTRRLVIVAIAVLGALAAIPSLRWILARDVAVVRGQVAAQELDSLEYLTVRQSNVPGEIRDFADWILEPHWAVTLSPKPFALPALTPTQRRMVARNGALLMESRSTSTAPSGRVAEYFEFLRESSEADHESSLHDALRWAEAVRIGDMAEADYRIQRALQRTHSRGEMIAEAKLRISNLQDRLGPLSRSLRVSQYGAVMAPHLAPLIHASRAHVRGLPLNHPRRRWLYELAAKIADSAEFRTERLVAVSMQSAAIGIPRSSKSLEETLRSDAGKRAVTEFFRANRWANRVAFETRVAELSRIYARVARERADDPNRNGWWEYRLAYGVGAAVLFVLSLTVAGASLVLRREPIGNELNGNELNGDELIGDKLIGDPLNRAARNREWAVVIATLCLWVAVSPGVSLEGILWTVPIAGWMLSRISQRRGAWAWAASVLAVALIGAMAGFPEFGWIGLGTLVALRLPVGLLFGLAVSLFSASVVRTGLHSGPMSWEMAAISALSIATLVAFGLRQSERARQSLLMVAIALMIATVPLDIQLDRKVERRLDAYGAGMDASQTDDKEA